MRALHVASTLLLFIAHGASVAWAQEAPAGAGAAGETEADTRAADHYLAGIRALEAGRDAEARAELLRAWELKRHWQIAANLGEVELRLGKYREAAEHLEHFLREAEGVRDEEIQRAEEMLREARRHVEAQPPAAKPPAAAVVADTLTAGDARRGAGLLAGGGGEVAPGSTPLLWPTIAAAGIAAAGIGVGVGFTIAANAKDAEADDVLTEAAAMTPVGQRVCPTGAPSACARLDRLLQEKESLTGVAMAGYAVGGVAAVGAAILAIWPVRVGERGGYVSVAPATGPGGGALLLTGKF